MANKKTKKSAAKAVKSLPIRNKKGAAVKGGITVTKRTDSSSPDFFKN